MKGFDEHLDNYGNPGLGDDPPFGTYLEDGDGFADDAERLAASQPDDSDSKFTGIDITVENDVMEEVASIAATLPGIAYYAENGEVLFLTNDGEYIISVEPDDGEFNNGKPTTSSAYLSTVPMETFAGLGENEHRIADDVSELKGWSTGWEC